MRILFARVLFGRDLVLFGGDVVPFGGDIVLFGRDVCPVRQKGFSPGRLSCSFFYLLKTKSDNGYVYGNNDPAKIPMELF
jgi:hypothetical protein